MASSSVHGAFFDEFFVHTVGFEHDSLLGALEHSSNADARDVALSRRPWEDDDLLGCVKPGRLPHDELLHGALWEGSEDEDEAARQQRTLADLTGADDGALTATIADVVTTEAWQSESTREAPEMSMEERNAAVMDALAAADLAKPSVATVDGFATVYASDNVELPVGGGELSSAAAEAPSAASASMEASEAAAAAHDSAVPEAEAEAEAAAAVEVAREAQQAQQVQQAQAQAAVAEARVEEQVKLLTLALTLPLLLH